ncbi:hypothetical protein AYI70_g2197 [Smittium culicis]|uniref:Uncharacterized protein n=1 Tax=Smittium culicis TaxID=133412 RepID=A0A1R1Y9L6_9FUNG|nr:hypothetical protein AYI70_g2197 [Smittium culicis]
MPLFACPRLDLHNSTQLFPLCCIAVPLSRSTRLIIGSTCLLPSIAILLYIYPNSPFHLIKTTQYYSKPQLLLFSALRQ